MIFSPRIFVFMFPLLHVISSIIFSYVLVIATKLLKTHKRMTSLAHLRPFLTRCLGQSNVPSSQFIAATHRRSISTSVSLRKTNDGNSTSSENKKKNNETIASSTQASPLPPVYVGTMTNMVYSVKHFSLFSSGLILAAQPILWEKMVAMNSIILQVP